MRDKGADSDAYNKFSDLLSGSSAARPTGSDDAYAAFDEKLGGVKHPVSEAEEEAKTQRMYDEFSRQLDAREGGNVPNSDSLLGGGTADVQQKKVESEEEKEERQKQMQQQYAEFAQRLGGGGKKMKKPKGSFNISDSSPSESMESEEDAKDESDSILNNIPDVAASKPGATSMADYAMFDALLTKKGGAKRKSVKKASKRWTTADEVLPNNPSSSSSSSTPTAEPPVSPNPKPIRPGSNTSFSAADAAEGYAMMAQAFGTPSAFSPSPAEAKKKKNPVPELVKPPSRPQDLRASQELKEIQKFVYDDDFVAPPAEPGPVPELLEKPGRPVQDAAPETSETDADRQLSEKKALNLRSKKKSETKPRSSVQVPKLADKPVQPSVERQVKVPLAAKPQQPAASSQSKTQLDAKPKQPAPIQTPKAKLETKPQRPAPSTPQKVELVAKPEQPVPSKSEVELDTKPEKTDPLTSPDTELVDTTEEVSSEPTFELMAKPQQPIVSPPRATVEVSPTRAIESTPLVPKELEVASASVTKPLETSQNAAKVSSETDDIETTDAVDLESDDAEADDEVLEQDEHTFEEAKVEDCDEFDLAVLAVDNLLTDSPSTTDPESSSAALLQPPSRPEQTRTRTGLPFKNRRKPRYVHLGDKPVDERWATIPAIELENPKIIVPVHAEVVE